MQGISWLAWQLWSLTIVWVYIVNNKIYDNTTSHFLPRRAALWGKFCYFILFSFRTNYYYSIVQTGALHGRSQRVTLPDAVKIQFWPPEDEHSIARNMSRYLM
jgi:hypothetical protein